MVYRPTKIEVMENRMKKSIVAYATFPYSQVKQLDTANKFNGYVDIMFNDNPEVFTIKPGGNLQIPVILEVED